MSRAQFLSAVVAALACLDAATAHAQTQTDLFDSTTLQEIRVFVNSRDLQDLRSRYLENTYYPADLQWRGIRVRNAAIRSHGSTSRSPTKPAFRVDFDRYVTGGRFVGLSALVLDNLFQDPGMVREEVAMAFFNRMGQPAPRESFCRLYVNDVYQGLYAIVEPVDTGIIARAFNDPGGFLFQYRLSTYYEGQDLGPDLEPYKTLFEAQNHDHDADTVLYSPIRDMVQQLNAPDDSVWRDMVEQYLDLRQLVTYVAIETFLSEEDGVLGIYGMNNFFLYRPAGSTRHRLLPWDKDKVFWRLDSGIFDRTGENAWIRRALAYDDLRALFLDVLEQCARAAADNNWLADRIDAAIRLVDGSVREDVGKPFTTDEFDLAAAFFRRFAQERPAFVLDEVARGRAVTSAITPSVPGFE